MKSIYFVLSTVIVVVVGTVFSYISYSRWNASHIKSFQLTVKDENIVSGPTVLQVRQGNDVDIDVAGDKAEDLIIDGYAVDIRLDSRRAVGAIFNAVKPGTYTLSNGTTKSTSFGTLDVLPY